MNKPLVLLAVFCILFLISNQSHAQSGWSPLQTGTTNNFNSIACPSFERAVIACDNGQYMINLNHSEWWQTEFLPENSDLRCVSYSGNDPGIICGVDGTILRENAADSTWETIRSGWMISYYGAFMYNMNFGVVVGQNSVLQPLVTVTTNNWQSYEDHAFYLVHDSINYEGWLTDVFFFDANMGVASAGVWTNEGAIVKTFDGGQTWQTVFWADNVIRSIDFPTSDVGYAVGRNGRLLKTTTAGDVWQVLPQQLRLDWSGVDFVNADTGWVVGESSTIQRTNDGGLNWIDQLVGPDVNLSSVAFWNDRFGYAVGTNGTILRTETGGVADTVPPGPFERLLPVDNDTAIITVDGDSVVFAWSRSQSSEGFPVQYTLCMLLNGFPIFSDDTIETFDTTYSLHIWIPMMLDDMYPFPWRVFATTGADTTEALNGTGHFILDCRIQKTTDPNQTASPESYSLSCFPNPFNPTTTISLSLAEAGKATITVYDLAGRMVVEKDFGNSSRGRYQMEFDARALPSGIYFARLQTGSTRLTHKMILMK